MKLAARKNATVDEQRRYQRQYDRDRAPPLRTAYPEVSQLSIELQAKVALVGPLQLQYAGEALPAVAQTDRCSDS